jgi:DNA-binding transcriptional MocR family regulator
VWGGLRLGWVRADGDLIRRLVAARPAHDLGTPEFEQAIATGLLARFDDVVAQRSALLRAGRDAVFRALSAQLPTWDIPVTQGGVSLWIELGAPLSSALVMEARSRGVLLSAGPRFSVDGGHERHLRVPFTSPPDEMSRAAGVLAEAWAAVRAGAPSTVMPEAGAVV